MTNSNGCNGCDVCKKKKKEGQQIIVVGFVKYCCLFLFSMKFVLTCLCCVYNAVFENLFTKVVAICYCFPP